MRALFPMAADRVRPRVLLAATMRNEGPYILEWVAHHLATGFTDIVICTNDCVDGSPALLDRLHELGVITHLVHKVGPRDQAQLAAASPEGLMRSGGSGYFQLLFFKYTEPVDAVERRHLVAFRQGRVIEYGFDEVIDFSTERQYRLTDMDQLARPFANDVDAEQLTGFAVKN